MKQLAFVQGYFQAEYYQYRKKICQILPMLLFCGKYKNIIHDNLAAVPILYGQIVATKLGCMTCPFPFADRHKWAIHSKVLDCNTSATLIKNTHHLTFTSTYCFQAIMHDGEGVIASY